MNLGGQQLESVLCGRCGLHFAIGIGADRGVCPRCSTPWRRVDRDLRRQQARDRINRRQKRAVAFLALAMLVVGILILAAQAHARPPIPPDVYKAVRVTWKSRADRVEAFNIVACETGGTYSTSAANGQYLGLFQMGERERRLYGHGPRAIDQARAAHRYWKVAGWRPWSCA